MFLWIYQRINKSKIFIEITTEIKTITLIVGIM